MAGIQMVDLALLAPSAVASAIMRVLKVYNSEVSRDNLAIFLRRDPKEVEPYLHQLEEMGVIKSVDGHVTLTK